MTASGISGEELFERGIGITYGDFTILNTRFSQIRREDISLKIDIGKEVILRTPIIASPMDTVTNARVCIAIALQGGIGAIHYNHKDEDGRPSIEQQVSEIEAVKKFQNGFIESPVTVNPNMTIAEVISLGKSHTIGSSYIRTFPVTDNGKSDGKLVGFLTEADYWEGFRTNDKVSSRMTPLENLVVGMMPIILPEAQEMMWDKHVRSLPIVDRDGNLKYLVTRADIAKLSQYPMSTRDKDKRLRVLFAVSTWPNDAHERLERGFAAGADGVIIDTSQGYSVHEERMVRHIKGKYPDKLLIGGNISTPEAALALVEWGVDAFRCGQGSGSICTTAGTIGISKAGASAVYDCSKVLKDKNVKVIADGGIKEPGDITKALFIGADCVMLGNLLAGTEEGPGEIKTDPSSGMPAKDYRGMGSDEAKVRGSLRGYGKMPEGVSDSVRYRGSIHGWVPLLCDAILHAFEVSNYKSINSAHQGLYAGDTRFERRTIASLQESGTHSLISTGGR